MREETREHQIVDTFALLPPNSDRLRLRGANTTSFLPTVVVDNHAEKTRKHGSGACLRRYLKPLFIIGSIYILVDVVNDYYFVGTDSTPAPPVILQDVTKVTGVSDLSTDAIQTRCFHKKASCTCLDPTTPESRLDSQQWARVHHFNKEAAESSDVDVLFLGDSITEGWLGTSWGRKNAKVHAVPQVFQSLFSVEHGGDYEGLALGIAGDASPNLLWRIQNGELPDSLNPSVIWVLIGTNDLANTWCSAEMVLVGIIRVVEELLLRRPSATIVLQGLLPRTFNRSGYVARGRSRKWWKSKSPPAMPSLWDDIEAVNEELKNYATSRDKVEYFETQSFFVDKSAPEENLQIDGKLMPDFLHPSAEGYEKWGQEIVNKLKSIMPNR